MDNGSDCVGSREVLDRYVHRIEGERMSVYSIDRLTKSILAERLPRVRLTACLRLLNLLIEFKDALTAHFKWHFYA